MAEGRKLHSSDVLSGRKSFLADRHDHHSGAEGGFKGHQGTVATRGAPDGDLITAAILHQTLPVHLQMQALRPLPGETLRIDALESQDRRR